MKFNEFLRVCHEKEVFKKLSLYVVFSWVLIQVISVIVEPIGLPENTMTFSIIILLISLPIYIFYVWNKHLKYIYSSKKKGVRAIDKEKVGKNYLNFQNYYFASLGVVAFICGSLVIFVLNNKFNDSPQQNDINFQDKIAVLKFENKTKNPDLDMVGDMAADWITHGISENKIAKVIAATTYDEFKGIKKVQIAVGGTQVLQDYFKPKQIITGNYFLKKNKLIFHGSILDGKDQTVLFSFKSVECDSQNPLDCIELLKQKILGFLVTKDKEDLNLQETPPKYEAYVALLDAKANRSDKKLYINLLNKSIVIDPNYFEPQYLRVEYYYDRERYAEADSLLNTIKRTNLNNNRQKNILNYLEALLDGNNKLSYNYYKKEYVNAPFDLYKNLTTMSLALEFVNQPEDVNAIFNEIDTENFEIENCKYCEYRNYIQAMAYFELGEYEKIIPILEENIEVSDNVALKKIFILAYIKLENYDKVDSLISNYELVMGKESWLYLCSYVGKMLLVEKNDSLSFYYFEKVIAEAQSMSNIEFLTEAAYYTGDFKKAESLYTTLLEQFPDNIDYTAKLAYCYYQNGKKANANMQLKNLELLREEYQYGAVDYALGQYYAAIAENGKSQDYLLRSVVSGSWFTNSTFQNDPHFRYMRTTKSFKEILNYWH